MVKFAAPSVALLFVVIASATAKTPGTACTDLQSSFTTCDAQNTHLVCFNAACSCATGPINDLFPDVHIDMAWNATIAKCKSRLGSVCTTGVVTIPVPGSGNVNLNNRVECGEGGCEDVSESVGTCSGAPGVVVGKFVSGMALVTALIIAATGTKFLAN